MTHDDVYFICTIDSDYSLSRFGHLFVDFVLPWSTSYIYKYISILVAIKLYENVLFLAIFMWEINLLSFKCFFFLSDLGVFYSLFIIIY